MKKSKWQHKSLLSTASRLLILLSLASIQANASEWKELSRNEESIIYYDKSKIKIEKGVVKVWARTDFFQYKEFVSQKKYNSAMQHISIKCAQSKLSNITLILYDDDNIIYKISSPDSYDDIIPDSYGETLQTKLCK
jgi:hypothetical protein